MFAGLDGVSRVESGYIGGHADHPTYQQVCGGATGHAEAIRVTYDDAAISYDDLLDVFFATHDPTQLNRQGNDVGTQYRSATSRRMRRRPRRRGAASSGLSRTGRRRS